MPIPRLQRHARTGSSGRNCAECEFSEIVIGDAQVLSDPLADLGVRSDSDAPV